MYKFGVRYYDPTLGRWTQQDPLGGSLFDPSTGNRYAYVDANPINLVDTGGASLANACAKGAFAAEVGLFASPAVAVITGAALVYAPPTALAIVGVAVGGCVVGGVVSIGSGFIDSLIP